MILIIGEGKINEIGAIFILSYTILMHSQSTFIYSQLSISMGSTSMDQNYLEKEL